MRGKIVLTSVVMIVLCLVGLFPAAAQNTEPVVAPDVTQGDQLLHENFNSAKAWEKYNPNPTVDFGVSGGIYSMHIAKSTGDSFIWGVNATQHTDVIISATFIQRAENLKSKFGLICRTDTSGVGYYFIVTGDGNAYIAKGLADKIANLTQPAPSTAIATGTDANIVRAICAGDYLALYVNDTLVAQATDSTYTSGVAGLVASSGGDLDADVTVDDLDIYQAVVGAPVVPTVAVEQPTIEATQAAVVTPIAFTTGELLDHQTFRTPDIWESYTTDAGVKFGVSGGVYNMHIPSIKAKSFFWGLSTTTTLQTDSIIEATLSQKTANPGGQYGVICRADNQGHGYYFIIGVDGYAFIAKATPGKVDDITAEVPTPAIHSGTEPNIVKAVCIGNYLALYVNDQFVLDANDSDYSSGVTGLTAATNSDQDVDAVASLVVINVADVAEATVEATTVQAANAPRIDGVIVGKALFTETFDTPDAWETFDSTDDTAHFKVDNGKYVTSTTAKGSFSFGQNTTINDDYVVSVDVTLNSGPINNAQGIICRATEDNDGFGYYLRISSDGYASIMRFDKDKDVLQTLVDWTESSAIKKGRATNTLTAVCVGDYIALYVNGTKAAEAHDSTYSAGMTGLTITEYDAGELKVSFDNLTLYNAKPG